jgi:hypothetical protein
MDPKAPMTSHVGRLYTAAIGLVVFFLAWTVVAAHPRGARRTSPQLVEFAARRLRLEHEAKLVRLIVAQRWATYRAELTLRKEHVGPAGAGETVRVVNLPPLTITRTS